jgi:secreted PhoX family phosphatase
MSRKHPVESSVAAVPAHPARRDFFRRGGLAAGGIVTAATLSALGAHSALAHGERQDGRDRHDRRRARASTYGELSPKADQNGDVYLALPKHFEYVTFSKTGDPFGSGLFVPGIHDGMAAFDGPGNTVRLIRNHELRNAAGNFAFGVTGPDALRYDVTAAGGCMTLDFDPKRKHLVRQFISIGGTLVNCAGGYSYRNGGWITCEETVAGVNNGYAKPHGYNFLVPADANSAVAAVPFKAMGRFAHEASVADERGLVYQTEDAGNSSGFYRFTPNSRHNLAAGGLLEMLAVTGNPVATLFAGQRVGARLPVQWVPIPVPDPALEVAGTMTCFQQGRAAGGAAFNRLEGIWRAHDGRSMYFVSTSGGTAARGQLWHYIPDEDGDTLVLVFESPLGSVLDSPDNMCVTPNGAILMCEDDASGDNDTHPLAPGITNVNRMVAIGMAGEPFEFAVNVFSDSEFAGSCFSPDGEILFVNLQGGAAAGSGLTCAIWGPWENGPL